jgi:hypothetical protein
MRTPILSASSSTDEPVTDRPTPAWRTTSRLAGVLALLSVASVVGSAAATGGDPVKMVTSPMGIGSSVAALAALLLLSLALAGLAAALPMLRSGFGAIAWTVATTGTVLVAGGYWASVFVQPGLADVAPQAIRDGLPSLTAGFIASYTVMGLGWIMLAVALTRSKLVGVSGWVLAAAALLTISPLPFRYLPIAVAAAVTIGLRLKENT